MKTLLFMNLYPAPAHGSMRREAAAFKINELDTVPCTLRRYAGTLVEEADRTELLRTHVLLDVGPRGLLGAAARTARTRPRSLLRAAGLALLVGLRSKRGPLLHLAYLAEACALALLAQREGIDHIHAHFGNSTTIAMLCGVLTGLPFSFSVHGPEEFDPADEKGLIEKCRRAAFVRAISAYTADRLRILAPEAADRVHVVHIMVEPKMLEGARVAPPAAPRLVWVGRMVPRKGLDTLLDALAILPRGPVGFELELIGDGPDRPRFERRVTALGLGPRVRFVGWGDARRIRESILAARALVLPSDAEGLPNVLLEALALGRPVIATAVAGIPELVVDGVNGWLVEPGDANALTSAIREALRLPIARLQQMGEAGRAAVVERYGPEQGRLLASLIRSSPGGGERPGEVSSASFSQKSI